MGALDGDGSRQRITVSDIEMGTRSGTREDRKQRRPLGQLRAAPQPPEAENEGKGKGDNASKAPETENETEISRGDTAEPDNAETDDSVSLV